MTTQPTKLPEWCRDDTDSDGNLLKVEPDDAIIQSGLLRNFPWARIWHNYLFNNIADHLRHLFDSRYAVGAIVAFNTTTEGNNFATESNYTWSVHHTDAVNNIVYYIRTA